MKRIMYRITAVAAAITLAIGALPLSSVYADDEYQKDSIYVETRIRKINSNGDVILNLTTNNIKRAGFTVGDEVKVVIKDYDYSEKMPFFVTDSDSKTDEAALVNEGDNVAISAANGSFAELSELFNSDTDDNDKIVWEDDEGTTGIGKKVVIYLHEKGTYKEQYELRNPERTNERDDYSSDKKYANFRNVTVGTIGEDILYRSSSPINDVMNRADYAAEKMEEAGVKAVINLSDSEKKAKKYIEESGNKYYGKLYDEGNVICLDLSYDFDSDEFQEGIGKAVKFMASHEGPYLVHCTEGKDRTGFLCALLESLMGASVSEMTSDYMQTYKNYYHYDSDSDEFKYTKKNYLREIFRDIADVDTNSELSDVDFHDAALTFLRTNGVSDDEINKVIERLSDKDAAYNEIQGITVDEAAADEKGKVDLGLQSDAIGTYNGESFKPGNSSLNINGTYMYKSRDYKISYSDNTNAGTMSVTIKLKKHTELYKSGIKKVLIKYTINPKKVDASELKITLNDKKTKVKSVKDLTRNAKIKSKYYTVDMDSQTITFNGNYTGKVKFSY